MTSLDLGFTHHTSRTYGRTVTRARRKAKLQQQLQRHIVHVNRETMKSASEEEEEEKAEWRGAHGRFVCLCKTMSLSIDKQSDENETSE